MQSYASWFRAEQADCEQKTTGYFAGKATAWIAITTTTWISRMQSFFLNQKCILAL